MSSMITPTTTEDLKQRQQITLQIDPNTDCKDTTKLSENELRSKVIQKFVRGVLHGQRKVFENIRSKEQKLNEKILQYNNILNKRDIEILKLEHEFTLKKVKLDRAHQFLKKEHETLEIKEKELSKKKKVLDKEMTDVKKREIIVNEREKHLKQNKNI